MVDGKIIGTIENTQASFRSVKIIDDKGNIKVATVGDTINEGERIVSDDSTAHVEVKYNGINENVTYEGVFDVLASASVVKDVDEDDHLVDANTETDNIETAAGDESISSNSTFVENNEASEATQIREVERGDTTLVDDSLSIDTTTLNSNAFSVDDELIVSTQPSSDIGIHESALLNLGAGEQSSYVGEKIVTEFLDIKNVAFSDVTLVITSDNKALLSIAEDSQDIQNEDTSAIYNLVKNMASDYVNNDLDAVPTQTVEVPSRIVSYLEDHNFLNIGMLPSGHYVITSPLFNAMGVNDSVKVSMNYSINGDTPEHIAVNIVGDNDTPVALDATQDVTLNDDGGYIGTLPGAAAYSVSLLKSIYNSADLDNGTSNLIDKEQLTTDVGNDIKSEIEFKIDTQDIQTALTPIVVNELTTDSVSVVEEELNNYEHTFDVQNALEQLIVNYNMNDDKSQSFKDFGEKLVEIYGDSITSDNLTTIENSVEDIFTTTDSKLSSFNDTLSDNQATILNSVDLNSILKDLGITNSGIDDAVANLKSDIKADFKTFGESLDSSSVHDPVQVAKDFNTMLDNIYHDADKSIENSIGTDAELTSSLTQALTDSLIDTTNSSTDDKLMMDIIDKTVEKIMDSSNIGADDTSNDIVKVGVNDISQSTLEHLSDQLGFDKGFLDDASRETIGNKIVSEVFERVSMDEDVSDLETLSYSLVKGSVAVNGESVSDDMVTINNHGTYSLNTQGVSIDASKITFEYTLNDGHSFNGSSQESSQSEPKTMTLNMDDSHISKSPAFDDGGSIDLHSLIKTVNNTETIALNSDHPEITLSIEDVIDTTDNNNELLITAADDIQASVHLDNNFEKEATQDGVVTYEGDVHGESVMLTIEDTIHVD